MYVYSSLAQAYSICIDLHNYLKVLQYVYRIVLYVIRKNPPKNVLVTKNTYKSVRANTCARNTKVLKRVA